jgi:hypothetical protein
MNGNPMIGVQMLLTLAVAFPQLGQNLFHWRRAKIELPEVCHQVRLPAAIHTTPFVADETKNTQPAMGCVITAFRRRPATFVPLLLGPPPVIRAIRLSIAEIPASR